MLTQEKIKELFDYHDGQLFYRTKGLRKKIGQLAGHENGNGYKRIDIKTNGKYKKYYIHRLIWLYHYGCFPEKMIDHIDGNRSNNNISNLREADNSSNGLNRHSARKGSSTGLLGVLTTTKSDGKKIYSAVVTVNKKRHILGNYKTAEVAHLAYMYSKEEIMKGNLDVISRARTIYCALVRSKKDHSEQYADCTIAKT